MMDFVVGWHFFLTPWGLSTWLGYWLASQFPNPSWQHRVSLKHLQITVILCHCVPILGTLCHMGGWDMLTETWSASHMTCSNLTKHLALLTNLVLGLLDRQFLRILILQTKKYFHGGCSILGGVCQLDFWENCHRQGMRNLNNQWAQLVGTSWD